MMMEWIAAGCQKETKGQHYASALGANPPCKLLSSAARIGLY